MIKQFILAATSLVCFLSIANIAEASSQRKESNRESRYNLISKLDESGLAGDLSRLDINNIYQFLTEVYKQQNSTPGGPSNCSMTQVFTEVESLKITETLKRKDKLTGKFIEKFAGIELIAKKRRYAAKCKDSNNHVVSGDNENRMNYYDWKNEAVPYRTMTKIYLQNQPDGKWTFQKNTTFKEETLQ